MFRTIVVKMCDRAMDLLDHVRSEMTDRAYWFFWEIRNTALGLGGDTVKPPCWYCGVGANNPDDPEDVSCRYCLSGEVNPEAERYRQKEGRFCWYCEVGAKHPDDAVPVIACEKRLLEDSLGIPPEQLDSRQCGCDRPRWNIRPCGHCSCASECDDCPANKLWRDEQDSWCGCAQPGRDGILACGHCSCGHGCVEVVRNGSHAPMQKVPCA